MTWNDKDEELLILSEDNDNSTDFSLDGAIAKENDSIDSVESIITFDDNNVPEKENIKEIVFDDDEEDDSILLLDEEKNSWNELSFDLSNTSPEEITTEDSKEIAEENKENDTFSLEWSDSIVEDNSQQEVWTMEDILSETIKKFKKREKLISEEINSRKNTLKSLNEEIKTLEAKVSSENEQIDNLNKEKWSITKNVESLDKMKNTWDKSTISKKTTK